MDNYIKKGVCTKYPTFKKIVHVFNQTIKRQNNMRVSTRNEKREKKCIQKSFKNSYVKEKK